MPGSTPADDDTTSGSRIDGVRRYRQTRGFERYPCVRELYRARIKPIGAVLMAIHPDTRPQGIERGRHSTVRSLNPESSSVARQHGRTEIRVVADRGALPISRERDDADGHPDALPTGSQAE
jgi:hypothetical protein